MAKITWKNGKTLDVLEVKVKAHRDEIVANATEALRITLEEGAVMTQDLLEDAHTRTGLAREERGGFPGRHDSGNMVGSISYTEKFSKLAKIISGAFGWFPGEFEQYMRDQDLGEGDIPAARALPQASAQAETNFKRRMRAVVKGKSFD